MWWVGEFPGNFLVSVEPPHRPVLLDFGLTKELRPHVQLALAKMLLAAAEVSSRGWVVKRCWGWGMGDWARGISVVWQSTGSV